MNIKIKIEKEFDAKKLQVKAGARYWEDAQVNGQTDDDENPAMPCVEDGYWCPIIDIDTGIILNWQQGIAAKIHYKVCDDGTYTVLDENDAVIFSQEGYVPDIMCPRGEGFGDYIIMNVNEAGQIENWKPSDLRHMDIFNQD